MSKKKSGRPRKEEKLKSKGISISFDPEVKLFVEEAEPRSETINAIVRRSSDFKKYQKEKEK